MTEPNEHVIPPEDDEDDENNSLAFTRPVYPRITRPQWAVLVALTDARCKDILDGAAFYGSLSKEAKQFLKEADEEKVTLWNQQIKFYANSKVIWKFLLVGGGMLVSGFIAVAGIVKIFGDYFTVKIK